MQRRSWTLLGICAVIVVFLVASYIAIQAEPEQLDQQKVTTMLDSMRDALHKKSVDGIMKYIAPGNDTNISGDSPERLRSQLSTMFRQSGDIQANYSNPVFTPGQDECTVTFDASFKNIGAAVDAEDFHPRVIMKFRKVEVPRMFGLFHGKEWRIVSTETTGVKLNEMGD